MMGVFLISSNGKPTYGINEYVIDTVADLETLPTDCGTGSIAFCIATSDVYMKNSSGEWVSI